MDFPPVARGSNETRTVAYEVFRGNPERGPSSPSDLPFFSPRSASCLLRTPGNRGSENCSNGVQQEPRSPRRPVTTFHQSGLTFERPNIGGLHWAHSRQTAGPGARQVPPAAGPGSGSLGQHLLPGRSLGAATRATEIAASTSGLRRAPGRTVQRGLS